MSEDEGAKIGYYATHPKYATDENVNVVMDKASSDKLQQEAMASGRLSISELQARYKSSQKPFAFLTGIPKPPPAATRISESYLLAYLRQLKHVHANEVLDADGRAQDAERAKKVAESVSASLRADLQTKDAMLANLRRRLGDQP